MIIARYLTKEVATGFLAVTGVLLLIALSNRFALYLAKSATGGLPFELVLRIIGLTIPELLGYLMPLALFVAILLAHSRLYADSEMTILLTSGVSGWRIARITLAFASVVALGVLLLTVWVVPETTTYREQSLSEGEAVGMMQALIPGRFQSIGGGRTVFYLEEADHAAHALTGVFVADHALLAADRPSPNWTIVWAESAKLQRDPQNHDFYLVFERGRRYQGDPGSQAYTVIQFEEYGRAMQPHASTLSEDSLQFKSSARLWQSKKREEVAEFQWRLSFPLSVIVLAVLAVPLAHVSPRQGRFAKFLPALLVCITYFNTFTVAKRWVAQDLLPSYLGVWGVHGAFLVLGLGLLARLSGTFSRTGART